MREGEMLAVGLDTTGTEADPRGIGSEQRGTPGVWVPQARLFCPVSHQPGGF